MSKKMKWFGTLTLILALIIGLAGQALAAGDNSDSSPGLQRIIVTFEAGVNEAAKEALIKRFNGESVKSLELINAQVLMLPPQAVASIAKSQGVISVEIDYTIQAEEQTIWWGVDRIDADIIHPVNKGTGVKVAVIDTGVDYTHPDLADNFDPDLLGYDFVNDDADPMDDHYHGTHVAGIIAAADNDMGVIGVAPEASLYALKVLDSNGSGYYSDNIEALQWCVDNGIQVANMSLGGTTYSASLELACDSAYNAGVLLVAAAGNDGTDQIRYPAAYDSVIAVSAININGSWASFSNFGDQIELSAPGVTINSTVTGGIYAAKSGTSMAAPHVAGAAALVIASGITGSPAVRDQLDNTAEDLGDLGRDQYFGYGLVDAEVAASSTIERGSISGKVTNEAGSPIADAIVTAGSYSTTTTSDGTYVLSSLPVGSYTVTASAESYIDASQEVIVQEMTASITDFALTPQPAGSIAGVVADAVTGYSIANATVTAGVLRTTTLVDGSYTLDGLLVGTYTVIASATGYYNASQAEIDVIQDRTATVDFFLVSQPPTGSITGIVKDEAGIPVAGATVAAGGYSTITALDGTYFLVDLLVGTYTVTASADGYYDASQSGVEVLQDQTITVDFTLLAPLNPGTISGTVTDVDTGVPVGNAVVTVDGQNITSAADGTYTLAYIPAGTYTVIASAEGYDEASEPGVVVRKNKTTALNFTLSPQALIGSVTGIVKDEAGIPIANATVTAGEYSTITASDGTYILDNVLAGTYTVTASAEGYYDASQIGVVVDGHTTAVDFTLVAQQPAAGAINGTVTDEAGIPIANATVAAGGYSTITASDGNYILAAMPIGTYTVAVSAAGYENASKTGIQVLQGQTTLVDFTLLTTPPGNYNDMYISKIQLGKKQTGPTIFLDVYLKISRDSNANGLPDESDSVVAGANVTLHIYNLDKGEEWIYEGVTDSNGELELLLKKVPEGNYQAKIESLTHINYTWNYCLDTECKTYSLSY